MDWKTETITLAHPIKVGEVSISSVTLTEPDVEALEAIDDAKLPATPEALAKTPITVKQSRLVVMALTRQPAEVILKMHRTDFEKVSEACVPLLSRPEASETGQT